MTNLNLCAVDSSGYCGRCGMFKGGGLCSELADQYATVNPDSGEYEYHDSDVDIGDWLIENG